MGRLDREVEGTPPAVDENIEDRPDEAPAPSSAHARTRPEPKPGSLAHSRMGIARRPEGVSEHTWERLASHVGRALCRATTRGASMLRPSVMLLTSQMRETGAPWEAIEVAVADAVHTHPQLGAHDRLNVVSGKRASDALIAQMIGWVHGVRQFEDPACGPPRRSTGDRIDVQRADAVLERLSAVLDRHPALARSQHSDARTEEVVDRALEMAVMELRFTLNQQTVEYLRWRVERARANQRGMGDATGHTETKQL